ncbi:MAG: hypothetical protein IPG79_08450 [Saprospiraceae bacterium]|nr:hypothetical protein [Saprospiraceae bacterium]
MISYDLQFNSQFQYSWKDFPELNTKELNDLPGGTYKVTVLDNLGCIKTLDAIIGSPDSIDIEIVKKDLNCIDVNSGEISLIPLNGVEPIKYLWSNSAITNKIENIISGLYKVTVSDSRNPTSTKPISPSCTPQTNDPRFKIGVYSVQLKNINNSNTIVPTNYRDYTNFFTFLAPNDIHELKIITGPDYPEKVLAWIDYNNNGIFDAEEMIMNSSNTIPNRIHINKFKIPENAIKHIPLRMRVGSDISSGLNTFNSSCAPSTFGHIEDYTVFIGLPACEVKEIEILPYSSEKPVIQLVNNNSCLSSDVQLTTDVDGKFLWNTGDTTRIIHIINSGIYSVTVTDNDNCSSASDPFDVILYSPGESIPPQ